LDVIAVGAASIALAAFGVWLVANRERLDARGRDDPNTFISAGYSAFIVFGLALMGGVVFVAMVSRY
jgi:hypothetical protein